MRFSHSSRQMHGVSLLEVVIAMALLLIGILGLIRLQVIGITADQGARTAGQAQELARELSAALARLDPTQDDLLKAHAISATPPPSFGNPFSGAENTNWWAWKDSYLTSTTPTLPSLKVVGVTPDAALERDPEEPLQPLFRRRWSVWQLQTSNQQSGVKLLAVSVVFRERTISTPRQVTLYMQAPNLGAATVNASAYR